MSEISPVFDQQGRPARLLVITGPPGGGKSAVFKAFAEQWDESRGRIILVRMSDVIRKVAARENVPLVERKDYENFSHDRRVRFGIEYWATEVVSEICEIIASFGSDSDQAPPLFVVEGGRSVSEINALRTASPQFVLVAITADFDVLVDRILSRSRDIDSQNRDEVIAMINQELDESDPYGFQIPSAIAMADCVIDTSVVTDARENGRVLAEFIRAYFGRTY